MKILNVIPYFSPIYGGPPELVRHLSEAEAALGATVDVVTTDADGDRTLPVPLQTWQPAAGYRVQYFPRQWLRQYTISLPLSRWLQTHIAHYDVVHLQNAFAYPSWPVYRACQRTGVPLIRTPNGMLEPQAFAQKSLKKRLFFEAVERPIFAATSLIQALTQREADGLRALGLTAPIEMIPNGVDPAILEPTANIALFLQQFPQLRGKSLILYLGRIDPLKGLDLLAEAFGTVHQQFPQAHLLIVGADLIHYRPTVEAILAATNCQDAVTFTGLLTGELKRAALAAADLYVSPSRSEGFSLSVLEGMGAGLPCVITTGCHFPEAAQAEAVLEVAVEAGAIAQALIRCLQNPEWAWQMGDRAYALILQNYTWGAIASQLLQHCERLCTKATV